MTVGWRHPKVEDSFTADGRLCPSFEAVVLHKSGAFSNEVSKEEFLFIFVYTKRLMVLTPLFNIQTTINQHSDFGKTFQPLRSRFTDIAVFVVG